MKFEIKDRDASGRICKFTTDHGTIITPNLMPVINPNKMIISPNEMKKLFGTEIVITNSYIVNKNENLKKKALDEGIHKLLDFNGPIMTDSGTFQSYVYGDLKIDPEKIVEFQREIGSDIGTILDIFITPDKNRKESEEGIKETIKRARKAVKIKKDMMLACPIQGSIFEDLREKCAKDISKIDADFYPIGGIVPLMENQRYKDLIRVIISSKKGLNPSKPVHLFGAGHPLIFPISVALGCDFFDSSSYIKYANDDRMIFNWGTEKLDSLTEIPCMCPICSKYNASELKKLDKKERESEIAKHNLYICFEELKKIRNAISSGNLWELVERRANSNPYLLEAINELKTVENKKYLETYEPISKNKAFFYTGSHSIHRPLIYRYHERLKKRYKAKFKTTLIFPDGKKPYSKFYENQIKKINKKNNNINFLVDSTLGPVPIELDEMYPLAQSIFPEIIDIETEKYISKIFEDFIGKKEIICWIGNKTINDIKTVENIEKDLDLIRISSVADMQFGKNAGKEFIQGKLKIVKSKKTGKIRNIFRNNKHILSMRASDGLFTLKIEGAKILHSYFKPPNLRVVIKNDAIPFVKEGKSVFAKFVEDCDKNLRPYDECLIVDKKDNLIAIGRCLLNKIEMEKFNYGVAVKLREKI